MTSGPSGGCADDLNTSVGIGALVADGAAAMLADAEVAGDGSARTLAPRMNSSAITIAFFAEIVSAARARADIALRTPMIRQRLYHLAIAFSASASMSAALMRREL
jgi:hypothetical protein